jgi:hypothetical protein
MPTTLPHPLQVGGIGTVPAGRVESGVLRPGMKVSGAPGGGWWAVVVQLRWPAASICFLRIWYGQNQGGAGHRRTPSSPAPPLRAAFCGACACLALRLAPPGPALAAMAAWWSL